MCTLRKCADEYLLDCSAVLLLLLGLGLARRVLLDRRRPGLGLGVRPLRLASLPSAAGALFPPSPRGRERRSFRLRLLLAEGLIRLLELREGRPERFTELWQQTFFYILLRCCCWAEG